MKKILIQFAAFFLVIACIFLLAGKSDGWTEPPEEAASSDIVLNGSMYNGKVVVNVTLRPDGTGEHEGNGEKSPLTWEKGSGDIAMIAHFTVKDVAYDMEVMDTGSGYSAVYPPFTTLTLTGKKPMQDIIISGEKYSGKVVVKITLHPDGTLEHEGNGTVTKGTWEAGSGDVAMVAHFTVKDADYDMNIYDNGTVYTADYPLVGDMQLTGAKTGDTAAPGQTQEGAQTPAGSAAPEEAPAEKTEAPAETAAPAQAPAEEAALPDGTYTLEYVADINAQLTGSFSCPPDRWQPALGDTGSYTPTDSDELLFSWDATGKSKKMDFFANGTFEFQFTTMSISEKGTWAYKDGRLSVTTEAGREHVAELTK